MNLVGACTIALGFAASMWLAGGEIRGKVYLKESGSTECVTPVDSARICCYVPGDIDSIITWTDSLGTFKIPIEEPSGRKSLIVSRKGFVTTRVHDIVVSENKTTYVFAIEFERAK